MPVQSPQWTEFLSCPICYNEFEVNLRRPISLGCGHTMCKNCLSKLQRKQCPFDQTNISTDINQLPENHALLQLVGGSVPEKVPNVIPFVPKDDVKHYLSAKKCIEDLALYLKVTTQGSANGGNQSNSLSRPMQRKLVTLINCQLVEEEGRTRAMRAARSLGERSVTELILQHQNPQQLSANLWAAVRARGCQFLGPAMQEEVLKLVLLALEDGSALSRKVLVMFVVQRLAPHFPQASKTSIGHVVQLLYRASCFKVSKREGDSSLMQLKEEFRTYEALRREHDAQIVQIATEAGLRIAPEQWSSLLYGDTAHKSHMQSIIDKLQTPQSFSQSVQELVIALQRTGDPGNLSVLRSHLELLAGIDPSPDAVVPSWEDLKSALEAARIVVKGLVEFIQNFGSRKLQEDRQNLNAKYKTSMCRDLTQRGSCPRGANCTFAHSQEEMEKYRAKNKRNLNHRGSTPIRTSSSSVQGKESGIISSPNGLRSPSTNISVNLVSTDSIYGVDDSNSILAFEGRFLKDNIQNTSHALNPETPAFQPIGPSQLIPPSALPTTKLSLNVGHISKPCTIQDTVSLSISTVGLVSSIEENPSSTVKICGPQQNSIQNLSSKSLIALQQRKRELLAQLEKVQFIRQEVTSQGNIINCSSKNMISAEEKSLSKSSVGTSYYSPWTSASIFSHVMTCDSSKQNPNNVLVKNLSSSKSDKDEEMLQKENNGNASFWPSEKDEFIPFDPPFVSKYGPISRCSKSLIRGPAPIQVNAVSQMGELTSPTSVVRHPLSSAALAPSLFAAGGPGFAVPVALIPTIGDQYIPVVESMVPVAMDCLPDQPSQTITKVAELCSEENSLPDKNNVSVSEIKEELWVVEKTIKERERIITKSEKLKGSSEGRSSVPTSIGPWPSQTLENKPLIKEEDDYEMQVGEEMREIEQRWLQELEQEEETWGDEQIDDEGDVDGILCSKEM
ncbi:roquin-2 isoform X3 [Centruroides vittatus]|uniref:roquin-2 isoform X3 n=1 Tax=Centruroides vittatus TaxID=120091 RepID=UPI003510582B